MSIFNANQVVPVVGPGQSGQLFNDETPTPVAFSQSLNYLPIRGGNTQKVWGVTWATLPSAAVVTLQCSNDNTNFVDILTWTFANAALANQVELGPSAYYRFALKSNTGGVGLTCDFQFA